MSKFGWRNNAIKVKDVEYPDKKLVSEIIPNLAAAGSAAIYAGWDVSAGTAALDNTDFLTQPPYPVCVQVYAVVGGTADNGDELIIAGYNAAGESVSEAVAIASTAKGSFYSNNAFAHITSITPDDAAHKSTDVNIGWGNEIGLSHDLEKETDIISYTYDGAYSTADAARTFTVNTTYNTVTLPTMGDGSTLDIRYLSKGKN